MCQETGLKWLQALPMVFFKVRCTPSKGTGYFPHEILHHRSPPILWELPGIVQELDEVELEQQLQDLVKITLTISIWGNESGPISLLPSVHPFSPGDHVWIEDWSVVHYDHGGKHPRPSF